MGDKDFKTLWKEIAGMYTDSSLTITDADSKWLWETLIKSYPTNISSSTTSVVANTSAPTISNTISDTIEYWTKPQWEFLKQCCENGLKLKSFRVIDEFGVTKSYDITFGYLGDTWTETFRITSQVGDDKYSYDYEYVSSTYSDSIELSIKLKYIMRAVYNHYIPKLTKP
jgi:hypothetical protein